MSSFFNKFSFLEDTLDKLKDKKISLIRLDSGFFSSDILDYLEKANRKYIIAAKFYHPIQKLIDSSSLWTTIDNGIEICDTFHKAETWDASRRIIIVRQKIKDRPKATGKQLRLFAEHEFHRNYRYSAYVTNLDFSAHVIWQMYRARGDAENRIKELKYDFGFDSFNLKEFFPTEAALIFTMIAYNLMSIFRIFVLQEKTQRRLSTLRHKVFAIGAFFEKADNKIVLKIALQKQRRKWFQSLWDYPIKIPCKVPNA